MNFKNPRALGGHLLDYSPCRAVLGIFHLIFVLDGKLLCSFLEVKLVSCHVFATKSGINRPKREIA